MRGYRVLKASGELDKIKLIKEEMASSMLCKLQEKRSELIFGAGINQTETIIRQYLLIRVADLNFNKLLLYAIGRPEKKLGYTLPPEWLAIVKKQGLKVSKFWSKVYWNLFLLKFIAYGLLKFFQILIESVSFLFRKKNKYGRYVFFCDISKNNLPVTKIGSNSYDIITWYWQKFNKSKYLNRIGHSAKGTKSGATNGIQIEKFRSALPPLENLDLVIKFICWFFIALGFVLIDFFRGRWWHALIFAESIMAAKVRFNKADSLALEYLFNNSGWLYRPLWTYEAKKRGSEISLYFYATNIETFKRSEGYVLQANNWSLINWPNYLVWDKYQAKFLEKFIEPSANISIVGPIWFQCSNTGLPTLPTRSVAIFDVQPVRDAFYETLGSDFEYYTPLVCNQFMWDVSEALRKNDCTLVHKRKRKMGKLIHYKYRNLLTKLESSSFFISVDADISAQKVIENCSAVISLPFTSTALLAKQLGKPSVYYDPSGLIQKDDRAAHGISIICGPKELNDWLLSVL
jgi:polysaccharide biosynthesis PFTS motif protein